MNRARVSNPELQARLEAMAKANAPKRASKYEKRRECHHCHFKVRISELKAAGGANSWECIEERACAARFVFGWPPPGEELVVDFARCACGEFYTRGDYIGMPTPPRGSVQPTEDDDGKPFNLELRNCFCGSTMAQRLR